MALRTLIFTTTVLYGLLAAHSHPAPIQEAVDVPQFAFASASVAPPEAYNDTLGERRDNIDERGPYYGGDMVLNEEQLAELKSGIIGSTYRWPSGRVPYQLDASFTSAEISTITAGINMIQSSTCIRFYARTSETAYVYIQRGASGTGCYSDVGRQTSKYNVVNLQYNGCIYSGIAAHELIHAIGYFHEQSRPDRDSYVYINSGNIQSGRAYNFDKYSTAQVSTYNIPYDYDSIMHYSAYAFAINTATPTLQPYDSSIALSRLGQRNGLSSYDAQKITAMYSGICWSLLLNLHLSALYLFPCNVKAKKIK